MLNIKAKYKTAGAVRERLAKGISMASRESRGETTEVIKVTRTKTIQKKPSKPKRAFF